MNIAGKDQDTIGFNSWAFGISDKSSDVEMISSAVKIVNEAKINLLNRNSFNLITPIEDI